MSRLLFTEITLLNYNNLGHQMEYVKVSIGSVTVCTSLCNVHNNVQTDTLFPLYYFAYFYNKDSIKHIL